MIIVSIYVYVADGQGVDCNSIGIEDSFAIYGLTTIHEKVGNGHLYGFSRKSNYEFESHLKNGLPSLIRSEHGRELAKGVNVTAVVEVSGYKVIVFGRNV